MEELDKRTWFPEGLGATLRWDFLFWAIIHFSLLFEPRFGFSVLWMKSIPLKMYGVCVGSRLIRRGQKGARMEPLRNDASVESYRMRRT